MENLKNEIRRIRRYRLQYYESHIDIVESYLDEKPDISIETCKALIEGISKLSLHLLGQEPLNDLNNEELQPLFKRAMKELQKGRGFSDIDLVNRLCSVIQYLGELRNAHSDIGHGRASLKDQVNDADFADLIMGVTDNLCTYLLRRLDQLIDPIVDYNENEEFNDYLDDLQPLKGNVLYSKALFDQEPETYEIELGEYRLEREIEEE